MWVALLAALSYGAPLSDDGLVEILTVSEARGDNKAVEVTLVALDTTGKPIVDLRLTSRASRGSASGWTSVSPGVYSFTFNPPYLSEPQDINVAINGRTPDKRLINSSAMVPVLAPWPETLKVAAVPGDLVVGQRVDAMITASEGDRGNRARASLNQGTLDPVLSLGGGVHKVHIGVGKATSPYVAIVGVGDDGATGVARGYVAVPVAITKSYTIPAAPDEWVMLRIGDREYGPAVGGPKGAVIAAEVPPGTPKGTLVRVKGGVGKEEPYDLAVVDGPRVGFLAIPKNVPADPSHPLPVTVVQVDPTGKPDGSGKLVLKASHGTVGEVKAGEAGRFSMDWTPALVTQPTPAWLEVSVEGSPAPPVRVDTVLVPTRPAKLELAADTSKGTVELTIKALDASGAGLAGRKVECEAFGAKASGPVKEGTGGTYTASFVPAVGSKVEVRCQVRTPASENPLRHVVLIPGRAVVRNDGVSEMPIRVASVDAYGLPVPGIEVKFEVEHGGGSAPVSITTDAQGLAEVAYTSGTATTAVRLVARAGRVGGAVSFLQVPDGVTPVDFPWTGTPEVVALDAHWEATSPVLAIGQ